MTNPHHPFTYRYQEIRHVGDLGDRYDADVWLSRSGWRWTARVSLPSESPTDDDPPTWKHSPGMGLCATEDQAVTEAVAWLRARCVEAYGSCG